MKSIEKTDFVLYAGEKKILGFCLLKQERGVLGFLYIVP